MSESCARPKVTPIALALILGVLATPAAAQTSSGPASVSEWRNVTAISPGTVIVVGLTGARWGTLGTVVRVDEHGIVVRDRQWQLKAVETTIPKERVRRVDFVESRSTVKDRATIGFWTGAFAGGGLVAGVNRARGHAAGHNGPLLGALVGSIVGEVVAIVKFRPKPIYKMR